MIYPPDTFARCIQTTYEYLVSCMDTHDRVSPESRMANPIMKDEELFQLVLLEPFWEKWSWTSNSRARLGGDSDGGYPPDDGGLIDRTRSGQQFRQRVAGAAARMPGYEDRGDSTTPDESDTGRARESIGNDPSIYDEWQRGGRRKKKRRSKNKRRKTKRRKSTRKKTYKRSKKI